MAIPIDQDLHQEVKDYIRDKYGSKKKVISYFGKDQGKPVATYR